MVGQLIDKVPNMEAVKGQETYRNVAELVLQLPSLSPHPIPCSDLEGVQARNAIKGRDSF